MTGLSKPLSRESGNLLLPVAYSLIVLYALSLVLVALSFAIQITISPVHFFISIIIASLFLARFILSKYGSSVLRIFLLLAVFLAIVSISIALSSFFYDLSWDGLAYHLPAIARLIRGWNPFYSQLVPDTNFQKFLHNHYSKGPWISSAVIISAIGDFEVGKSVNLLLLLASMIIVTSALKSSGNLPTWKAVLFSFVLAFNPVTVTQVFTYYVDGQVASTLLILISMLLILRSSRTWAEKVVLASLIIVALNTKLTGAVYTSVVLLVIMVFSFLRGDLEWNWKPFLIPILIGFALGIFVVGFNPFVTNTIKNGHPLYPILGESSFYPISDQLPSNYYDFNPLERFFLSISSPSQNPMLEPALGPKNSLSVTIPEISIFKTPDVRVGGFGPLFGLVSLISGALLIGIIFLRSWQREFFVLLIAISISSINPEAWWARLVPQVWLIPGLISVSGVFSAKRVLIVLSWLVIILMALNVFLVATGSIHGNLEATNRLRQTLSFLKENRNENLLVYTGIRNGFDLKLQENNIKYKKVPSLDLLPCPFELGPGVFVSYEDCSY